MGLSERAKELGWGVVKPNRVDLITSSLGHVVQQAKEFLGGIDQALEHSFAVAAQRHNLQVDDHFLGAIARWFDEEGITAEGFPVEDPMGPVSRVRDLKDLYVGGTLPRSYFLQLSRYTTKSGKRGYAFVAHKVERGKGDEDLKFGEVVEAYRVEERAPGVWGEYDIDPDPQGKLGFLAEISSDIYDYYALVIPSEPGYGPSGSGGRVRLAA